MVRSLKTTTNFQECAKKSKSKSLRTSCLSCQVWVGLAAAFSPLAWSHLLSNLPASNSQPAKAEVVVWICRNQSRIVVNCDHRSPFHIQVKRSGGGRRLSQQMLPYSRLFGPTYSSGTHYTTQSARCRGNMGNVVGLWGIQVQAERKQVMSLKW